MAYTLEGLSNMMVAQLREIAEGVQHESVHGYTTMHKDDLVKALCTAFDIDMRIHHDVVGIDKASIKKRIRDLKKKRDEAIDAHNYAQLKMIRREIHYLKRRIHKATV